MKALQTEQKREPQLLSYFLGRNIHVKCEKGLVVCGKLICFEIGDKRRHVPPSFNIENARGGLAHFEDMGSC